MTDAGQELRDHLRDAFWSRDREDRVLAAIQKRQRSHTLSTVGVSSALVAVTVALAIMWLARDQRANYGPRLETATQSEPALAPAEGKAHAPAPLEGQAAVVVAGDESQESRPKPAIRLDDGSTVLALGSSQVRLLAQNKNTASFEVDRGKVWFDVQPEATRTIEVRIADVRVEVLATEFVVEKKGEEVFVWVQRGSATVSSQGQEFQLRANEEGSFPAHEKVPAPSLESTSAQDSINTASPSRANKRESTKTKGTLSVGELWSLADSARLEGRLPTAIQSLQALVKDYPKDPRAALAAFTLGRLLLETKASPRRVAKAFELARTLAPRAPLAEDALAREIEALWRAKADAKAMERSKLYEDLFPDGRHIERNRRQR